MKTKGRVLLCGWALVACLLDTPPVLAQAAPDPAALHTQQLAAEREALQAMLDDANTPAEKRALIRLLLDWNARGGTISEFKQRQIMPAAPVPNLAEAEAAPLPANVNVGGGALLQNFSKGRDADAAARSSASLGLVKTQQELENAMRESEAKLREAQQIRNSAGASALAQRQQDAASAASQQAAGGLGAVMGESLVQSVQQGAQAAGQAIGGGAAGRMSGVAGSSASGGGAAEPVGGAASAAAGQIFGGDAPVSPAAVGGAVEPAATPASGAIGFEASALGDGSAKRAVGKRLEGPEPWQRVQGAGPESSSGARLSRTLRGDDYPSGNRYAAGAGAGALKPEGSAARSVRALFDAVCSKHGKYGGEVGKVKGCPQCEAEKNILWDAVCSKHGKYGGRGPRTGCPECNKWIIRDAK